VTKRKQKKRKKRAVLGIEYLRAIRAAGRENPRDHAVVEFVFTNAQRASEPGLTRLDDLDLHNGTVSLTHLKGGLEPEPMPLSRTCLDALKTWLPLRIFKDEAQRAYVFPSANPTTCYPCKGTRTVTQKSRRKDGSARVIPCPHCHAMGTRWGMSRHEMRHIIVAVFKRAGIPPEFHFPHVLRHSAVTHMLNTGLLPPEIQERVGHKDLATTFGYMHATEAARAKVNKAFDEDE